MYPKALKGLNSGPASMAAAQRRQPAAGVLPQQLAEMAASCNQAGDIFYCITNAVKASALQEGCGVPACDRKQVAIWEDCKVALYWTTT